MSSVRNKISSVKRLSALAQLVQLYAEKGITSTAELSAKTGFSDRHIWRARAELRLTPASAPPDARVSDAGVSPPEPRVSLDKKQNPSHARPLVSNNNIITTSKNPRESMARADCSLAKPNSSLPTPFLASHPQSPPPVWRGQALEVSAEQDAKWRAMWPNYDLRLGYPIADAECAERGKANGAAVLHAQKKLGFLASDFAIQQTKGMSPEEAKEERLHAWLRSQNPHYVDARRG